MNSFLPQEHKLRNEISNYEQRYLREVIIIRHRDRYKDLLRACPHHGFTELHQLDTFYNALNPTDQDSLNSAAGGNLLERSTRDVLTIIENKSKVRNSRNKSIISQVKSSDVNSSLPRDSAKLTHAVKQQTSCLAADGNTFLEFRDNIQGYVTAAAGNYNQGNSGYRPPAPTQQNQSVPLSELEKIKKINDVNIKAMQAQINNVKNELRNEMQTSIQASMSNQTNELKNAMASFFQMNTASTSDTGSLPSNTIANPKGDMKAIITRSGLVLDGPSVLMPPPFINPEKDERVEETLTDPDLTEFTIKVYPSLFPPKFELANREICTPVGIARDVFVPVGRFTFPADFIIVDYESDPRAPLILGRPFLRTARALIDVHREEMILRDGDERLTLNMRHDTSSYSNKPKKESINMIDIYNISHKEYLEDLFANEKITNHPSGNPTSYLTSHTDLTSPEVNDDIFDAEGDIIENLLGNSNPSSPLPPFHNSLSGSTTSSSPSLPISETSDYFLEEFADELAHFAFPPGIDYLPFDIKSDLREIEYLLNHDPIEEMDSILEDSVDKNSPDDNLVDTISEMFTDEHALDYSSPPLWDDYDDELFDLETVNDNTYDDPFDSKEEKIKDSKILIDELDPPRSSDFLPSPECDSVFYEDFSEVDTLTSTDIEDKVFNPGILINENLFEVTIRVSNYEKNVKKTTNASLILEDFNPPLYELPFHKEVPGLGALLSFSSENEEKVFNPGILTSKGVHTSLLPELSHRGPKAFKVIKIFESPMEIFPCSYGEDIRVLDVPCLHFYPP
ncbi:reverse transcriptase domain-containing protein [Tanacetum coccineum]